MFWTAGGNYEVLMHFGDGWLAGLEIDPEGFRMPSFELEPHQAAPYRLRMGKRRASWASLPDDVKATVREWIKED